MVKFNFILLFFICPLIYFAQKVNNVEASQQGQNIVVTYDLETEQPCTINLFISTNGGKTWQGPLKQVQGQVGPNIKSGQNSITLFVLNEFKELRGDNIRFKVDATDNKPSLKVVDCIVFSWSFPGNRAGTSILIPSSNLELKKPFSVQLLIQNVGQGIAKNAELKFNLPDNVFMTEGFELMQLKDIAPNEKRSIVYELIANNKYKLPNIVLTANLTESFNLYGENWTKTLALNQSLAQEKIKIEAKSENKINIETASLRSDNIVFKVDALTNNLNTIKIGTQTWTTKNLDVTTYRNGEVIPQVQDANAWANLRTGAWCYYENNTANGSSYGKLYNWYAVNDPRGLAPKGYHIPTDAEWTILSDNLGDEAGTKMKSSSGWKNNGNGTNTSGFAGLPGGYRFYNGDFYFIGATGYWWSSSESTTDNAWSRYLSYYDGNVGRNDGDKLLGFSVRCLRD